MPTPAEHRRPAAEEEPRRSRWAVKTSVSHPSALAHVRPVALARLLALPPPPGVRHADPRYENARIPRFPNPLHLREGDLCRVRGYLWLVAAEEDGDYHLQLAPSRESGAGCLIVEVPNPAEVKSPTLRRRVTAVRRTLDTLLAGRAPSEKGTLLFERPKVAVEGQLFFDDWHVKRDATVAPRGKRGMLSGTAWELHPVTRLRPLTPRSTSRASCRTRR